MANELRLKLSYSEAKFLFTLDVQSYFHFLQH